MLLFTEAVPPGSAFYIPEERHAEVLEASWGSRTTVVYQYYNPVTVVCTSWTRHAIRGGVVRRSCSGPFNQSWRSHAEVVSCDRYTKYYKSHGAVCLFRSRRRHGVHGAPCDWGISSQCSGRLTSSTRVLIQPARDSFRIIRSMVVYACLQNVHPARSQLSTFMKAYREYSFYLPHPPPQKRTLKCWFLKVIIAGSVVIILALHRSTLKRAKQLAANTEML